MKNNIIAGIDIGTTKIVAIIAEIGASENKEPKIIGFGEHPSIGLNKGVIVNINDTINSMKKALENAEKQADVEINSAFVGITGNHIKGINYNGIIAVNKNQTNDPLGAKITEDDIIRVKDQAQSINLSPDRKILHVLPQNFKVDNKSNIKNPLGLTGHRLEVNVHLVTTDIKFQQI